MSLYHIQLGLPKSAESFFGKSFKLTYSRHAKLACINDRYGIISKPPFNVEVTRENIIEVETLADSIVKIVIRVPYDGKFDAVLAILPLLDFATVKTIWLNAKNDLHFTLDKSKYVC